MLAALAASVIAACGGGGGSDGEPVAGIDRGGVTIAQGPISGFGSVIVNGVRYSTSGATITVDDRPGTESDLRVGQVVRVEGTVDVGGTTGTARSVSFNDELEGPVQSIDVASSRMVVLGQTVQVNANTSFDDSIVPRGLEGLQAGQRIEVSGLVGADGVIAATRIELKAAAATVEVKGTAQSVDTAARRFRINQQQVDYSGATLSGFASGQPANGDFVEVDGTVNGGGVLLATRVERRSTSLAGSTNDRAEIEGLVTRFASAADFDVAGQRVTTTTATRYEDGSAANLALNVNVEVEGGFDASGRIVATEVEFRQQADIELAGPVDAVNAAASTFVMLGATVRTTTVTRFEDKSDADVEPFGLADLRVGDYVEVKAYRDAGGLVATLLEREDAESTAELSGIATDVAQPNLRVGGIPATTGPLTEYRDNDDVSISAATFFAAAPGREVKVRGSLVNNVVLADEAELED
jgi:cold shock CspA family protein